MKLFQPEDWITNNPDLFSSIENRVTNNDNTKSLFYLMSDSTTLTQNLVLGFPYIPEQISFSYGANYNRVSRSMASTEDLQYTGSKAEEITANNMILSTRAQRKSFLPIVDILRELMSNQSEPSFFYIGIQSRILYPYVLSDMTVNETGWIDGLPVEGRISLSFIRSPWGLSDRITSEDVFYEANKDKREGDEITKEELEQSSEVLKRRIENDSISN